MLSAISLLDTNIKRNQMEASKNKQKVTVNVNDSAFEHSTDSKALDYFALTCCLTTANKTSWTLPKTTCCLCPIVTSYKTAWNSQPTLLSLVWKCSCLIIYYLLILKTYWAWSYAPVQLINHFYYTHDLVHILNSTTELLWLVFIFYSEMANLVETQHLANRQSGAFC